MATNLNIKTTIVTPAAFTDTDLVVPGAGNPAVVKEIKIVNVGSNSNKVSLYKNDGTPHYILLDKFMSPGETIYIKGTTNLEAGQKIVVYSEQANNEVIAEWFEEVTV